MRVNFAGSCELGGGFTPRRRVGTLPMDIWRDSGAREVPDVDALASPLGGVDSAIGLVESTAVGLVVLVVDRTTGVFYLTGSLHIAVTRGETASEAGIVD